MEAKHSTTTKSETKSHEHARKSHVSDAANDLLNESKKLANELYEEGLNKIGDAELQIKAYSDSFTKKIVEKPLTSLLIAGGIGFIISKILSK